MFFTSIPSDRIGFVGLICVFGILLCCILNHFISLTQVLRILSIWVNQYYSLEVHLFSVLFEEFCQWERRQVRLDLLQN